MGTMKKDNGGGGGEIVQVQGGHIVRATGRKDRHSKVYTSKGLRDRRVRLSAHTAIQFYDVQDRLGFDRPSKAVDWLITKAKPSIDKLSHLPPWHPTTTPSSNPNPQPPPPNDDDVADPDPQDCGVYEAADGGSSSFMPPPELDSDSMKLFFPTSSQDLGLSLHSNFHGGQAEAATLFAAPDPDGFGSDGTYQRLMGWGGSTGLGLAENPPPPPPSASSGGFFLINQNNISQPLMMIPQRVPLQSNNIQLSPPVPSLGGFNELSNHGSVFRRGRFISDGQVGFGFQGRGEEHNGGPPPSTSPNSGHH